MTDKFFLWIGTFYFYFRPHRLEQLLKEHGYTPKNRRKKAKKK